MLVGGDPFLDRLSPRRVAGEADGDRDVIVEGPGNRAGRR
jgi:hypothetical protein